MSAKSNILAEALKLLLKNGDVAVSRFGAAQTYELNQYASRTNAIRSIAKGNGRVYSLVNREVVELTYRQLRPIEEENVPASLPARARNIAVRRHSKAGKHRHDWFHQPLRAIGEGANWTTGDKCFAIKDAVHATGMTLLPLAADDKWVTDGPLWLIENQALFDDLSWVPDGVNGTLAYYQGVLSGQLVSWLGARQRCAQLVLFPDYDGVGLQQLARLAKIETTQQVEFWLFPQWEKLLRKGSSEVWQTTRIQFESAVTLLQGTAALHQVSPLIEAMQRQGLALEQEATWLGGKTTFVPERPG